MQASRRSADNVPAKKRYKAPSPKKTKKIEEQQLLYDLAKSIFNRSVRFVDVQTRYRKKENFFKIKLNGFDVISEIPHFCDKIAEKCERYKFEFTGCINSKTAKQEVFLYITIFNQEGSYGTKTSSITSQCGERKRHTGVFGSTEVRLHPENFTGR